MFRKVKIIAHRSGPSVYPEQTVMSASHSLKNGADMIEVDVRFTLDKKIAVCHDSSALRVFGIEKEIDEMTGTEFSSLVHKNNPAFKAHLLEDYLKAGIKPLLIHIKENEVIGKLVETLTEYGYTSDDVVFGIQSADCISELRNLIKNCKILAFLPKYELADAFIEAGVDYIRLWEKWTYKYDIKISFPVPVWIMTDNGGVGYTDTEKLENLLNMNIDGILLNEVEKISLFNR